MIWLDPSFKRTFFIFGGRVVGKGVGMKGKPSKNPFVFRISSKLGRGVHAGGGGGTGSGGGGNPAQGAGLELVGGALLADPVATLSSTLYENNRLPPCACSS